MMENEFLIEYESIESKLKDKIMRGSFVFNSKTELYEGVATGGDYVVKNGTNDKRDQVRASKRRITLIEDIQAKEFSIILLEWSLRALPDSQANIYFYARDDENLKGKEDEGLKGNYIGTGAILKSPVSAVYECVSKRYDFRCSEFLIAKFDMKKVSDLLVLDIT